MSDWNESADWVQVDIQQPGIALVTLNRPERRNALSIALMVQLIDHLEELAGDGQTRVVVLKGAGPVFSAGLDLAEAQDHALVRSSAECVAKTLSSLRYTSLVTIAALHGGAYAGGAGVVSACDMAVAASDSQIGFPEARRGLLPALISDYLRTKIREGDLAELFLREPISAQRAQAIGLVQRGARKNCCRAVRLARYSGGRPTNDSRYRIFCTTPMGMLDCRTNNPTFRSMSYRKPAAVKHRRLETFERPRGMLET